MIDLGGDTTGNGVSKLVFTILSAVAEAERDRTRERIADVKRDQKARGRFLGGIAPYGYRVENGELVTDAEQQATVRKITRLRKQGLSLWRIAERMTADGTPISHMGVRAVLARKAKQ
jgi:putative DNA-invertase from lambdoid prophage Rac